MIIEKNNDVYTIHVSLTAENYTIIIVSIIMGLILTFTNIDIYRVIGIVVSIIGTLLIGFKYSIDFFVNKNNISFTYIIYGIKIVTKKNKNDYTSIIIRKIFREIFLWPSYREIYIVELKGSNTSFNIGEIDVLSDSYIYLKELSIRMNYEIKEYNE
jgi:hypothetical protein